MKKLIPIAGLIVILLTGCSRYPNAEFTVNYTRVQPDEELIFTNYSDNAISYHWDFGDGTYSNQENPIITYDQEGTYTVVLSAESKEGKTDRASIIIEVAFTELEVTVAEWTEWEIVDGYEVRNALVILYETYHDWAEDINDVGYGYTDHNGRVTFYGNLLDINYYIYAEATDVEQEGDGFHNLGFDGSDYIYTEPLVHSAINLFTCWVDYYFIFKDGRESRLDKYPKDKIKGDNPSFIFIDVSK